MWDLDTLGRLNEQAHDRAHDRAVERANQQSRQPPSPASPPVYPLAKLAGILITGPPSLSQLINLLEGSESIAEFLELVREYVPEYEAEIMGADIDDYITEFSRYFSRRYFPLSDQVDLQEYTIEDFVRQIPVDLMGFSYDDYHEFQDFRHGYVLMLSLVESPYFDDSHGARVPLLEEVAKIVGKGLMELIPPEGWKLEDLHRILDATKYNGVATFADWSQSNTGCWQLDTNYGEYEGELWSREVVGVLTKQWPKVINIQDKISEIAEWIEEDVHRNFAELLSCILNRKDLIIPKEQLPFPLDENVQGI